jgi:hypothetical protein
VRRTTVLVLVPLLLALTGGVALAVFTQSKTVPSNAFSTSADWTAPTVSSSVIAKTTGYWDGYIKQGGTYYVYANVSDGGNPPSGVSTVTANVSTVTTGQTATALSSGSYSVEGVSYNYRTASLTANSSLSAGSYSFSITATDTGGRSGTQTGFTVTLDNTAPSASDIQTANGGAIAGRADIGDTITFTYSEPMESNSILSGWTGSSTNVVVRLNNGGISNDTVTIYNSANSAQLPLGSVNLGRTDYATANLTFGLSGTPSTMVMSGSAITVTLGTQSAAATTAASTGTMSWTPSATATDRAGNACTTTARSETGAADKEF